MPHQTTRRSFLKKSAVTTGVTILPSYLALGKEDSEGNLPPSKRVNLGCIGAGGRANGVVPELVKGGAKVVALADVDFKHRNTRKLPGQHPDAKRFADFRVMFDEMGDDIDAVSVVIPDHTHFVAAMDAMRRGKHVYCEKPLAHSFDECEMLMKAEKKFQVVTQMGNQGHTGSASAQFKQMVENGLIKDVKRIDAWKGPGLWFMKANERMDAYPPEEAISETLNWDLWCGPAELKPFNKKYHPFDWRAFHLYGMGMLGDWGCHIIDFAHHYLNLGLPTEITNIQMAEHNQVIFPLSTELSMKFPARGEGMPECLVTWRDGADCHPDVDEKFWDAVPEGKEKKPPKLGGAGTLIYVDGADFVVKRGSHGDSSRLHPYEKTKEHIEQVKAPKVSGNHQQSFVKACMGEGETWSPFSVGAPLTQVLCLGVICQYLNPEETLLFDPQEKRFTNSEEATRLLKGPAPREGWEEFYKVV